MDTLIEYFALVSRLGTGGINRSENDLSSNLKNALASFGLFGVFDTSAGSNRLKRPDITLYKELAAADVGSAADVVIEAKKPYELENFPTLTDALVDDSLWNDKFIPYMRSNSTAVSYFILTTFEQFLILPVSPYLRVAVHDGNGFPDVPSRLGSMAPAVNFDLRRSADKSRFADWCAAHLSQPALEPPSLSSILDLKALASGDELEDFASALADVVVGPEGHATPGGALLATVRLGPSLDDLDPAARQAAMIYTMAANGGMSADDAVQYLTSHLQDELAEFVGASVHSLVGRLFAVKAIEDCFCLDTNPPLIDAADWVFHSDRFDELDPSEIPSSFFRALGRLSDVDNAAIRDLAATGRFYDWMAPHVDPAAFRRLLALFFAHNFSDLDGDLLGRFFEVYAQRVDKRRRKQLGQYYTPLPIVRHMWRLAIEITRSRGAIKEIMVLDPGVGSGTFLIEGSSRLQAEGVHRFWERLTGFDISAQAICIAQVNLYLGILAHLERSEADHVGTLRLYPTDALDPRNGAKLRGILPLLVDPTTRAFLQRRIELSEEVKQPGRFPVVIGNPPYRNNSNQTLAQVAERLPRLLRSSRDNARARTRNIRDDYAWFFAAADYYVGNRGIVAFVVSDSFCYAASYRFFREDLLRLYHIRHLVNLGAGVFRDVGPRTQFVIVVLERRDGELRRADDCDSTEYVDLTPLSPPGGLHDAQDPRLVALAENQLPAAIAHTPTRQRNFSLYPAAAIVARVNSVRVILHGDSPRRVFLKKWPGVITAFDELFRERKKEALADKIRRFFAACERSEGSREAALDELAHSIRATSEKNRGRLSLLAKKVVEAGLRFETQRLRRVATGAAPNDAAWYPDERQTAWIYYEPRLALPRNVHEGRNPGWGTMSQWREATSHAISPKLVFTTGTNPEFGLKAFVLPGDWMVKLHGGESQQFHYTGMDIPSKNASFRGPNNLGEEALNFHLRLIERGHTQDSLLFYVAAIYNSQVAEDYLSGGGGSVMRIPLDSERLDADVVDRIIDTARRLRNVHWLIAESAAGRVNSDVAEQLTSVSALRELGFEEVSPSGGRFVQRRAWQASPAVDELTGQEISRLRELLDNDVNELFPTP